MQSKIDRKQAVREYKERKIPRGAYAVRCTKTGDVWVGCTPNLEAARNRTWFSLRMGNSLDRSLQAAWNTHGADAFVFEVLETLDDVNDLSIADLLKEKRAAWVTRLGAEPLR
jgi:hypothetical protein